MSGMQMARRLCNYYRIEYVNIVVHYDVSVLFHISRIQLLLGIFK